MTKPKLRPVGDPEPRPPTRRLDTTVDADADKVIRLAVVDAEGKLAAFWEAASRWIASNPHAMGEILDMMTADLGGRRRRYP